MEFPADLEYLLLPREPVRNSLDYLFKYQIIIKGRISNREIKHSRYTPTRSISCKSNDIYWRVDSASQHLSSAHIHFIAWLSSCYTQCHRQIYCSRTSQTIRILDFRTNYRTVFDRTQKFPDPLTNIPQHVFFFTHKYVVGDHQNNMYY